MRIIERFFLMIKKPASNRRGRLISLLALTLLIGCAAIGFAARAYSRRASVVPTSAMPEADSEAHSSPPSTAVQSSPPGERIEASVITLRPSGFDPKVITRSEGPMILVVLNRAGLEDISLNLDRQAGNRLRAARVNRHKPRWGEVFNLSPGEYTLGVEGRPEWSCRITVTAK
jgi:hypothetical protein